MHEDSQSMFVYNTTTTTTKIYKQPNVSCRLNHVLVKSAEERALATES